MPTYYDEYSDVYDDPMLPVDHVVSVTFAADTNTLTGAELEFASATDVVLDATGDFLAAPEVAPVGVTGDVAATSYTATGALLVGSPTVEGPGGQDITVGSVLFTGYAYAYMQPTRVRRNPTRVLVSGPTPEITAALEAPQVNVWRVVDILNADETMWRSEAEVVDGKVGVDLSRDERRTLDITFANADETLSPDPTAFWYDKIIRVRRGVQLDGIRYEFDLGHFVIDQITPSNLSATVAVTGRDYTKKMMKSKIEAAQTFLSTERVEVVIRAIAYNAGVTRTDIPFTGEVLGKDFTFDADTARWEMVKQIATAFAYDIYFAPNGTLTMRKQQDPVTNPPVMTFGVAGRNTVSLSPSTNDSEMYNHVVVTSPSSGDTLPVWASVENNEPSSPTRIERIGRRTKRMESALATTTEQCREIAQKFLAVSGLEQFEMGFSALNYPWLDVGSVVEVDNPKAVSTDPTTYLLTGLDIPLALGPMTGSCKRITVVGNTVTAGGGGAPTAGLIWGDEAA